MRIATSVILVCTLTSSACDDPLDGAVGGIVLVINNVPSEPGSRFSDVSSLTLDLTRIEVTTGDDDVVVVTTVAQQVMLANRAGDRLVAQFQAPVGAVGQIRLFVDGVTLSLADGTQHALDPDVGSALPSWRNTGWKIELADGSPIPIVEQELIGVRAFLDFDDRLVRTGAAGNAPGNSGDGPPEVDGSGAFKVKPTLPAELFDPTPESEAGVLANRLTVVFEGGTSLTRREEILAEVGDGVIMERRPVLSRWHRVKLPVDLTADIAAQRLLEFDEVLSVMPAINFAVAFDADDDDDVLGNFDLVRVRDAWDTALERTGDVGSHTVRIAVIETGRLDLTHPDLYQNIAINQGELPTGLFDDDASGGCPAANGNGVIEAAEIACFDCDPATPDGVVSIRDLECNSPVAPVCDLPFPDCVGPTDTIAPCDCNENGLIDGEDLLNDARWVDGDDTDDFDPSDADCCGDDLVGWNFTDGRGSNRTHNEGARANTGGPGDFHAMVTAAIIGAVGNNSTDLAGVLWRVSLVPIVVADNTPANVCEQGTCSRTEEACVRDEDCPPFTLATDFASDVLFADAVRYVEKTGSVDIANISLAWNFASEKYDQKCSEVVRTAQTSIDVPDKDEAPVFSEGIALAQAAYADLFDGSTETLYVVAAGNSAHDTSDEKLYSVPGEALLDVQGDAVVVVGGVEGNASVHANSNYGRVSVFAPYGPWIGLAPGGGTLDGDPSAGFATWQGTSFAAPTVAGAAGLLLSIDERFRRTPAATKEVLRVSASYIVEPACAEADQSPGPLLDAAALLVAAE